MATFNYENEGGNVNQETDSNESNENDDVKSKTDASNRETSSNIFGNTSTRSVGSSYLYVGSDSDMSGQTLDGGYQLPMPSDERNKQVLSDSYLSLTNTSRDEDSVHTELSEIDSSYGSYLTCQGSHDEENKGETEIRKQNVRTFCNGCKKLYATHFCKDCKDGGKFICRDCLQSHDTWSEDHNVVSLSVETERYSCLQQEDIKCSALKFPPSHATKDNTTAHRREAISNDMSLEDKDKFDRKTSSPQNKIIGQRFFKDSLFLKIIREQQTKNQLCRDDEKLQKYGTYSIRTRTDKKPCVIVGITQLKNRNIVLADSENRELKILNHESFKVILSLELPNNPYLTCFIEGNRLIVAYITFDFCVVDLTDGFDIESVFEIKHMFKSIAYANNELFGCTVDTLEIYNESGQQKSKFKPAGVTAIEDMCVSKEGELVYCADETRGIVIIDRYGNVVGSISENIYIPQRLCVDHTENLFVTEKKSQRIVKVDLHKKTSKEVGREQLFENYNPIALYCEKTNCRLVVSLWQSDEIHVYTYQ